MKGTLHRQGTLHRLSFERRLPHPPEKVWRALTENDELAHWFPAKIEGPRKAGAKLRFVFPLSEQGKETGPTLDGEMILYDPPRTLEYSWGADILRWELQAREGHTFLLFTHTFEDLGRAARDASGWDMCLSSLLRRLDGDSPEPFTMDRFDALFDDYAQRFGREASTRREPDA